MTADREGTLYLGVDVGTNGLRVVAIDAEARSNVQVARAMPLPRREVLRVEQDPGIWWRTLGDLLGELAARIDLGRVGRIAVDGTSGTLLLVDAAGRPRGPGVMYNDARGGEAAKRIARLAPPESGAHGSTSALARLMTLLGEGVSSDVRHVLHQADWIAGRLAGVYGFSDENNALKMGYDPVARQWPGWIDELGVPRALLPEVRVPGARVATIDPAIAERFGFSAAAEIRAGTTDGTAAFIATGAAAVGDAVTSLGSTLVVKLLAGRPIFEPDIGIYSHRLGERWLAGGASNTGGAALLMHFTAERMAELTPRLVPERPTGLRYYPLPAKGERFPIRDPEMTGAIAERPVDDARFLQGLLEGIAEVEALAYRRLVELGAPALRRVLTVGGGARNPAWTNIRARAVGVPVLVAGETEAAYGAALLALRGGGPA
jgi:sugar (pentulose or hexulose) kinase